VYNNIAREYFSMKQYDTALDYYRKTQRIYENIYGEYDSDTAEVYGSIAKTYIELKKYNYALEWCSKALEIQKKTLGDEHPEVILRHSFISDIYENLEMFDEAISHLIIILNYYIKDNYNVVIRIVSERIANDYEKIGDFTESKKYQKIASDAKSDIE